MSASSFVESEANVASSSAAAAAASTAEGMTGTGEVPVSVPFEWSVAFWSQVFLFIMTLGLSATVEVKHLRQRLSNTYAIACGVGLQYLIMPLAGLFSVLVLRNVTEFTPAMGLTLLVLTSSPGGSYSTWWCSQWNADLPLSVAMTTVSSILGVFLLPFNLYITTTLAYGNETAVLDLVDFKALFQSLALVIFAILAGLIAGFFWDTPKFHDWANKVGNASGLCLVVLGVTMTSKSNQTTTTTSDYDTRTHLWQQPWVLYVGVAMPFFIGICLPNFVAQKCLRLSKPETVAVAIECCYQNNGIATSVAIAMFQGMATQRTQAIAVPLIYGLLEATCIPLYCVWAWKAGWTKAPPGETLWTVLAKSYESCHDEINHPHAGILEESTATAAVDVKWMDTESTISYSPISSQINPSADDLEQELKDCRTSLVTKLAYHRGDTLDTDSEESFV